MKNDYLSKTGFKCGTLVQDVFNTGGRWEMQSGPLELPGTTRVPLLSYCSTKPIDYFTLSKYLYLHYSVRGRSFISRLLILP